MTTGRKDIGFNDPRLTNLNFHINKDFTGSYEGEVEIKISMYTQKDSADTEDITTYISTLKLDIGENSNNFPFYCELEMTGVFYRTADSPIEEQDFANFNTAAILYSYARPIVSDVVSKSGFPPYNLPFMNFAEADIDFINE